MLTSNQTFQITISFQIFYQKFIQFQLKSILFTSYYKKIITANFNLAVLNVLVQFRTTFLSDDCKNQYLFVLLLYAMRNCTVYVNLYTNFESVLHALEIYTNILIA